MALAEPFRIDGQQIRIGASVGVAISSESDAGSDQLMNGCGSRPGKTRELVAVNVSPLRLSEITWEVRHAASAMCGLQPIVKELTIVILTLSKLNENQKPKAAVVICRTTARLPRRIDSYRRQPRWSMPRCYRQLPER